MPQMTRISRNNTRLVKDERELSVRLYNTVVAHVDRRTGIVTLNHDGFVTRTIMTRITQFLRQFSVKASVFIKGGVMYVSRNGQTVQMNSAARFTLSETELSYFWN
jgi:hypothetical protein